MTIGSAYKSARAWGLLGAERRAGELLRAGQEAGEIARKDSGGNGSNQHKQVSRDSTPAKTVHDLGISRDQSSKWKKLAEATASATPDASR